MKKTAPAAEETLYKAFFVLLFHPVLLFFVSTSLWIKLWIWVTSILIIVWVAQSYLRVGKSLGSPLIAEEKKQKLRIALLFLTVLWMPYMFLPGFLFCYPLSDYGFRIRAGNDLQACVISFLRKPDKDIKKKPSLFTSYISHVDRSDWPVCIRKMKPARVALSGQTPQDRNLDISFGGGFGHWGFVIGNPQLQIRPDAKGIRQMWPGVYCYTSD